MVIFKWMYFIIAVCSRFYIWPRIVTVCVFSREDNLILIENLCTKAA